MAKQILARLLTIEWTTPRILTLTQEVVEHAQSSWPNKLLTLRIHRIPRSTAIRHLNPVSSAMKGHRDVSFFVFVSSIARRVSFLNNRWQVLRSRARKGLWGMEF